VPPFTSVWPEPELELALAVAPPWKVELDDELAVEDEDGEEDEEHAAEIAASATAPQTMASFRPTPDRPRNFRSLCAGTDLMMGTPYSP